jgi:hypothetical protein
MVGSTSEKTRKESLRKFVINKYNVKEEIWGVKKRYTDVPGTPVPKCKIKKIGAILKDKGLKGDDTASLNLDPNFAFATDGEASFNINVQKPRLHLFVAIDSCKIIKEL